MNSGNTERKASIQRIRHSQPQEGSWELESCVFIVFTFSVFQGVFVRKLILSVSLFAHLFVGKTVLSASLLKSLFVGNTILSVSLFVGFFVLKVILSPHLFHDLMAVLLFCECCGRLGEGTELP